VAPPDRVTPADLRAAFERGLSPDEAMEWVRQEELTRWREAINRSPVYAQAFSRVVLLHRPDVVEEVLAFLRPEASEPDPEPNPDPVPERVSEADLLEAIESEPDNGRLRAWIHRAELTRWQDRIRSDRTLFQALERVLYLHDPSIPDEVSDALRAMTGPAPTEDPEHSTEGALRSHVLDRLKEIAEWGMTEDAEGNPVQTRGGMVARLNYLRDELACPSDDSNHPDLRRILDADEAVRGLPVKTTPLVTHGQHGARHELVSLPWGIGWCRRCGVLVRRGETFRYYAPGIGEVSADPLCPTTKDP